MLPLGTRTERPLTEDLKDVLVMNIGRMTLQPLKIQVDIELKCSKFDAVLHTKEAIRKLEAVGNDDCPVKIKLVVPPLYVFKEAIRKSEAVGNDDCPVKKIKLVVPPLYVLKGVYHEHTLLGLMTAFTSASSCGIPSSNAATKFLLCPSGSGGVYIASGGGSGSGMEDRQGVPEVFDADSIKYLYAPIIRNIRVIHIYQNLNYKAKVGEDSLFPDSGLVAYPDLNCPLFALDQSHWWLDTLIVDPVRSDIPATAATENIRYLYSRQSSSAVLVNHNSLYNHQAGEASTDPIPIHGIHAFPVQSGPGPV